MIAKLLTHIKNGTLLSRMKYESIVWFNVFYRGKYNRIRYGYNAPYFRQTLYINPSLVKELAVIPYSRLMSGTIVKSDHIFDEKTKLEEHYKFKYIRDRYVNLINPNLLKIEEGRNWEDVDRLFHSIKDKGLNKNLMNYGDGIIIHFDSNATPIFGGGGFHRLSIAKILDIPQIPVEIGLVHYEALKIIEFTKTVR